MKIRTKLLSCVLLLCAVIAALAIFAVIAIRDQAKLAETTVADRVIPMQQLKEISDDYAISIVDLAHKVRTGDITPTDGAASVRNALTDIDKNWNAYMATYLTDEEHQLADSFVSRRQAADTGVQELVSILDKGDKAALATFVDTKLYKAIDPVGEVLGKLIKLQIRVAKENLVAGNELKSMLFVVTAILGSIAALVAAFSIWTITKGVISPLNAIGNAMQKLADGDTEIAVFGLDRSDEVGAMAKTVAIFRDNALERRRLEKETEENRALSEQERRENERRRAEEADQVRFAVESLATGLDQLAAGKLNYRISSPFAERLDQVRGDFNSAVTRLEDAMRQVAVNAQGIAAGSSQIKVAASDLSHRTEQQAASVEETAAALEEITTTVADSSRRAEEAGRLVGETRGAAERSGEIVRRAVGAMEEIERSSGEISNIIGVIDDIAFQTNLLALNAGVEAARAGEAGKGFAVVAQEVRELAQRSATAAKEIKTLIGRSAGQVATGVDLVTQTGEALESIVHQVKDIDFNVRSIVEAAREQSTGLNEINQAVGMMDQNTQQNAAMVEESTAASHSLSKEAEELFQLISSFEISGHQSAVAGGAHRVAAKSSSPRPIHPASPQPKLRSTVAGPAPALPSSRSTPSPARKLMGTIAGAFGAKTGTATAPAQDNWEEF
ncbi:HAMP domain-containing methyl-accepting chemotaxis protein [Oryzifoliimicrobium ureilyticus]|uniref:HAMP domain-containing methyl-accepting chemotaxis protein n=1 Tax=Oryzifoliimicrobium ureilyticus TaxID=3113724 RepID=UPI0030767B32